MGVSVLVYGDQMHQEFPDKEYHVPNWPGGGGGSYNLSSSKIIVLYVQFMLTHYKFEFLDSEMVNNLLSVTDSTFTSTTKHGSHIGEPLLIFAQVLFKSFHINLGHSQPNNSVPLCKLKYCHVYKLSTKSISKEMNNDNELNLHSRTKLSGWLCHWSTPQF